MNLARVAGAVPLFLFAAFCTFGFLASFEGRSKQFWAFRIAYVSLGGLSLLGALALTAKAFRRNP